MHLSPLNSIILGAYLLGMALIGLRFSKSQKGGDDFFLAGRNLPWWAVGMSMYASLTSAVTYLGLPAMAFKGNLALLAVSLTSPMLVPVMVWLFYPFYRNLRVTTSYEYLQHRFGSSSMLAASTLFVLARLGWLGLVIYAPALAMSAVSGLPLWACILLMGGLATFYTAVGGLAAVVWTDVAQFVILFGGAILAAVMLCNFHPDGLGGILATAQSAGFLDLKWTPTLTEMTIFGTMFGFFFQMMQDYGTDQVTVQRLLAARDGKSMTKAIVFNAGVDFLLVALLLFIGLGLFAWHQTHAESMLGSVAKSDQIFPWFIIHGMPDGVSGLLIAGIFAAAMSSMDSGINSISTVVVRDFYPAFHHRLEGRLEVRAARRLTVALGVLSTLTAFYVHARGTGLIEQFASFMSLFNAPVLALFLMGMLTRWATFKGWLCGVAVAVPTALFVQHREIMSWVYFFPFSLFITLLLGMTFSLFVGVRHPSDGLTIATRRTER